MVKRLLLAAALVAAVVGLSACGPHHRAYCYGEGGVIQACVSPGSPGTGR